MVPEHDEVVVCALVCACGDEDEKPTPGSPDSGNGHQLCADFDALWTQLATQLSCGKPFSSENCETILRVRPQCEQPFQALYDCGKAIPNSEWRCDNGKLKTSAGCMAELQAYEACAFPDGG